VWVSGGIDYFQWWQCFVVVEMEMVVETETAAEMETAAQ
jgi:hypothetical protein